MQKLPVQMEYKAVLVLRRQRSINASIAGVICVLPFCVVRAAFDYATAGSLIQAQSAPVPLCVSYSLGATLDVNIQRLVRLLQALNSAHRRLFETFRGS